MSGRLLVLTWHNVHPTWCFPARRGVGARGFAKQLAMCRRLANVVPLEDAARRLAEGRPLPPRAVALTFDDGYRDNLSVVLPLLRRLGLPATFFLVPGILDSTVTPWWEVVGWLIRRSTAESVVVDGRSFPLRHPGERARASSGVCELLKRRNADARAAVVEELRERCRPAGTPPGRDMFLDWSAVGEIARAGFGIGSHTCAHHIMARENAATQCEDLARSRRELESNLSVEVRHLAYPNGKRDDYDAATITGARSAGYAAAWTTRGGFCTEMTPPFELRRYVIDPARGAAAFPLLLRQYLAARADTDIGPVDAEPPCASSM
ncbi:MAG: polysaccharide deacetylase family protein [Nocardioides sp.]|nr:polysaccharide deacetylase family protein [Nocardioides sp.]